MAKLTESRAMSPASEMLAGWEWFKTSLIGWYLLISEMLKCAHWNQWNAIFIEYQEILVTWWFNILGSQFSVVTETARDGRWFHLCWDIYYMFPVWSQTQDLSLWMSVVSYALDSHSCERTHAATHTLPAALHLHLRICKGFL